MRWRLLFVLFIVSFVNYLLRNELSVAAPSIRAEFGFTSTELGWIIGAFNISYTLLQIPGGIFGERFGPRLAFGSITVTWGVLTWFTGFAPGLMAATAAGAMFSLIVVRLRRAEFRRQYRGRAGAGGRLHDRPRRLGADHRERLGARAGGGRALALCALAGRGRGAAMTDA